jgi:hypothetical protein
MSHRLLPRLDRDPLDLVEGSLVAGGAGRAGVAPRCRCWPDGGSQFLASVLLVTGCIVAFSSNVGNSTEGCGRSRTAWLAPSTNRFCVCTRPKADVPSVRGGWREVWCRPKASGLLDAAGLYPHASAVARPGRTRRHRLCRSSRAQPGRVEPRVQRRPPATALSGHRFAAPRRFTHRNRTTLAP